MRRGGPASAATRALNDSTSSAHPRRDCRLHATVGMLSSRRVAAAPGVAVATHQAEATRSAPPSRAPGLHPPLPLRRRCSPSAWAVLPARAARLERSRPASSRSAVAAVARNANRHRRSVHCLRGPVHHAAPAARRLTPSASFGGSSAAAAAATTDAGPASAAAVCRWLARDAWPCSPCRRRAAAWREREPRRAAIAPGAATHRGRRQRSQRRRERARRRARRRRRRSGRDLARCRAPRVASASQRQRRRSGGPATDARVVGDSERPHRRRRLRHATPDRRRRRAAAAAVAPSVVAAVAPSVVVAAVAPSVVAAAGARALACAAIGPWWRRWRDDARAGSRGDPRASARRDAATHDRRRAVAGGAACRRSASQPSRRRRRRSRGSRWAARPAVWPSVRR